MTTKGPTVTEHPPDSLLTAHEVATILNVSLRTVRALIADGRLPSLLIYRARRVVASDLAAFVAAAKVGVGDE